MIGGSRLRRYVAGCLAVVALGLAASGCDGPTTGTAPAAPSGAAGVRSADDHGLPRCTAPASQAEPVEHGLPDLTLDCLVDGDPVRLSDLRGKPLLVNIWAQWCGPCRAEAPYLAKLAALAKSTGALDVIGIDIADPRPELAVEFAAEHKLLYPHLRDPDKRLEPALNLVGPPATLFVTADGEIAYVHLGPFTSYDQLEKSVRDHLGVTL